MDEEKQLLEKYKQRLEADKKRRKRFYDKNKAKISNQRKEQTTTCPCGGRYFDYKPIKEKHFATKRHKKYIQKLVEDLPEDIKELII